MKTIKYLNLFAIGLPISLGLIGLINKEFITEAIASTIITGFIQIMIGFGMFIRNPRNRYIQIYLTGVFLYFSIFLINIRFFDEKTFDLIRVTFPPVLAIYLTTIIHKTKE